LYNVHVIIKITVRTVVSKLKPGIIQVSPIVTPKTRSGVNRLSPIIDIKKINGELDFADRALLISTT
jgi:hypothetical protein